MDENNADMPPSLGSGSGSSSKSTDKHISHEDRSSMRRQQMVLKRERVEKMRSFLMLKKKIYALLGSHNTADARVSYQALYGLYHEIMSISNERERADLQRDMNAVYQKITEAIHAKGVKKGHIQDSENSDKKDAYIPARKKIITTAFDVIVNIVDEKGRISLSEIQSKFNISRHLAEEWVQILADYGVVEIRYLPVGGVEVMKPKGKINKS